MCVTLLWPMTTFRVWLLLPLFGQAPFQTSPRKVFFIASCSSRVRSERSLASCHINESKVSRVKHGLVLAGVGDAGPLSYKKSRRGNAEIDHAAVHILSQCDPSFRILDFSPYGYDERQYCSPGFNLAVGRLSRTRLTVPSPSTIRQLTTPISVRADSLAQSFAACCSSIFSVLERNHTYVNTSPKCEPQLGARGLYRAVGGSAERDTELAMLWVLNLSDGDHTLLDIADRARMSFDVIHRAAVVLRENGLLKQIPKKSPANTGEMSS